MHLILDSIETSCCFLLAGMANQKTETLDVFSSLSAKTLDILQKLMYSYSLKAVKGGFKPDD